MSSFQKALLGQLCDRITVGHVGAMADRYQTSGIPFLRSQDIKPFAIETSAIKYIDSDFDAKLRKSRLRTGDVVIVRTGYPGTAAVVPPRLDGANCADLVIVTPGLELDSWFAAALLNSTWGRSAVAGNLVGVAQQHFNVSAAKALRFALPTLPVQRRIGEIVKAYCDLINVNKRRISHLNEVARRLYENWFEHTPSREEWPETSIREIATVYRGRSYKGSQLVETGGVPFINLKCIARDGGFRRDGVKGYSGPHKTAHEVRAGDLVIAITDMTQERRIVGQCGRVPNLGGEYGVFSMDLVKIEPNEAGDREWLYAWLRWSSFPNEVRHHANGTNVLHLNIDRITYFKCRLPPRELRSRYSESVAPNFVLSDNLAAQNEILRAARDLLIPKMISGEIDVGSVWQQLDRVAAE